MTIIMDIQKYTIDWLKSIEQCKFLSDEDYDNLIKMSGELQETFEKKQVFRTETEMRTSILNNLKFPTNASKYWQCIREQSVFFENLITLSFEYKRNNVKIKRLTKQLEDEKIDDLEREELEIDLEEALFIKKNMEIASKDRMREIKLWSKIKDELDDWSFDIYNVDNHQLLSYTQRYLLETAGVLMSWATLSWAEARNLIWQTTTMLKECDNRGKLKEAISVLNEDIQQKILPNLWYKLINKKNKKIELN